MATPIPPAPSRQSRPIPVGVAVTLGIVLFFSYAYFFQGGGWNQNTRLDFARAVVEHGTVRIDRYASNTLDRAVYRGHIYADKAPGQPIATIIPVALTRPVLAAADIDANSERGTRALGYFAQVTTSSLPAALAGVLVFCIAFALGASTAGALLAALAFGLATPMWAYGTLLWEDSMAVAALLLAFACCIAFRRASDARRAQRLAFAFGLAGAWAVITNFATAPAVAIIGVVVLLGARRPGAVGGTTATARAIALGAAGPFAVLAIYNTLCFGSPFHLGYQDITAPEFKAMNNGFFGLRPFNLHALAGITIGSYRGVLRLAPALVLTPIGLYILGRRRETRAFAIAAAAIAAYFVFYNASYTFWPGGWTYGPRQMSAALPFLCLGLAPLWDAARPYARAALIALVGIGGVITLAAVATDPQLPTYKHNPLAQIVVPAIEHNNVAIGTQSFIEPEPEPRPSPSQPSDDAFNLGSLSGIPGLWSLLPLLAVWGLGVVAFRRLHATHPAAPAATTSPAAREPEYAA
jgi:hypothetical protein